MASGAPARPLRDPAPGRRAAARARRRDRHRAHARTGQAAGRGQAEVTLSADIIDFQAEEGKRLYGRTVAPRVDGILSHTVQRVPVGPVAAFTPWNFPVNLPSRKLGSALAAGCSVVLKPAEETPENDFLERATAATSITAIDHGRVSLYACMDGVINETPRGLALSGAQVLCNSLNSFALDEANLHIPVRAAENKVFVVAAEKVASLIPAFLLEPVSQATRIPAHFLHGAGESQIVAPDGRVLATGPRTGEAIVVADIDPAEADNKRRPDGTDVFAARRPELYGPIGHPPAALGLAPGAAETRPRESVRRHETKMKLNMRADESMAEKTTLKLVHSTEQTPVRSAHNEEIPDPGFYNRSSVKA